MRWTEEQYQEYLSKKKGMLTEKPRKTNKYNNQKTIVDEIEFDSKKEAEYYCMLKILRWNYRSD